MKHRSIFSITTMATLGVFAACAGPLTRAGHESADYRVEVDEGVFQIRAYEALIVATVPVEAGEAGRRSAFMKLFSYISGENDTATKISMTTPVFTSPGDNGSKMSFVVPKDVAAKGPPAPSGDGVTLTARPAGRYAAVRFSGRWTERNHAAARDRLIAWMEKRGLDAAGEAEIANYDPPYTPPGLRRNEVLVPLR